MEKNALQTELGLWKDVETFTVARQIDHDMEQKIDRKAFQKAAQRIALPKVITDLDFIFITLICQANDQGKNEVWEHEGGAYINLALPYQYVVDHSAQEVVQQFLLAYQDFVQNVTDIPNISTDAA